MTLQIVDSDVQFAFPLQLTADGPVKGEIVQPVNEKLQYRVRVSYTVRPVEPAQ